MCRRAELTSAEWPHGKGWFAYGQPSRGHEPRSDFVFWSGWLSQAGTIWMTDRNVATHPVALGHPEPFYWIGSDISPVGWSVEPIKGARQI